MFTIAHQSAVENASVLHRDMSEGNWLIYKNEGRLIDWELCKFMDEAAPRVNQRTVSVPLLSLSITVSDSLCSGYVAVYVNPRVGHFA